eukprot:CAMPEP_0174927964 /NCGR_PEP_ID=MMETSP1355-20121228/22669_1 /TAXON_ID=464990 /ORGANISM="Hemiselmis tepida, Strain CCMP443" /LENGTH=52 /DNA_ID=CAMNT_0016174103 /DNA_START=60 /DNA_END=218 /DNA_ORIENTATION=+
MALHPRLGAGSTLGGIDLLLLREITELASTANVAASCLAVQLRREAAAADGL